MGDTPGDDHITNSLDAGVKCIPGGVGFAALPPVIYCKNMKSRIISGGALNVRGCGMDEKKCMIVDLFKERKLDILALSETEVKGQGVQRLGRRESNCFRCSREMQSKRGCGYN